MTLQRKIYSGMLALSVFSFMACGKKVQNTDPNAGKIVNRTPALSASNIKLVSRFNSDGAVENDIYKFQDDAWLTIPEHVFIESGEPLNFTVRVFFNTKDSQALAGEPELFCEYRSAKQIGNANDPSAINGYYHHFAGCFEDVDGDGTPDQINYSPGSQVAQNQQRYIRLEYVSGFTDEETQVSSDIEIDWY